MNAFAAAMGVIVADPNIGVDATYRAGGVGAPVAMRVARSVPDRVADAFGTAVLQGTDVLAVPTAVLPTWAAGDTFTIGTEVLTVQHAEKDATGAAWRVMCAR